ncbi:hypothetical protein BB561_002805 [Smittium simulii]|uniref:Methyltransferase domain-containing protein n=1 Tax=Smittium simulii TaxID=133385 RepID=A0A2T9YP11_9FUNG|nr:hypothetical protein BB561_002805 [Smittium simulii]
MTDLGFPIIGNSKLTKPLKNSSDKGLLLALTAIKIYGFPNIDDNILYINHSEPLKFESIINRELKFYNKKLKKQEEEIENLSLPSNLNAVKEHDPNYDIPVSYITMKKIFYGHTFSISRDTLIPRPSTEVLVDAAIETIKDFSLSKQKQFSVLDLGTGSGCVLISIILNCADKVKSGMGIDLSEPALKIAKENSVSLDVASKTKFMCMDFTKMHLSDQFLGLGSFDIIVCNPPYISTNDYANLNISTSFEPSMAICAGNDKYKCYEEIRNSLDQALTTKEHNGIVNENTVLIFEVGKNMEKGVIKIFESWKYLKSWNDSQESVRCVAFVKNKSNYTQ